MGHSRQILTWYNLSMATNDRFGDGQDSCKICGDKLQDVRVLTISITHKDGTELANIRYFAPLCDKHRQNDCLDVNIGWDADLASVDEMKDDS